MTNICDTSVCKPLELLFRSCPENGKFPTEQLKANVVPGHKKGDKQNLKNYGPASLLPVAEKIFERILYNNTHEFFAENNLISPNQTLNQVIYVLTNFCPSLMKFTNILTMVYF